MIQEAYMLTETMQQLEQARVIRAEGSRIVISMQDREVPATLAIAYPYQPVEGDLVLAIGQDEKYFVIGVIQGTGKCRFTAPGDIEFNAPRGQISLLSSRGVQIQGPQVSIKANKFEVLARSVMEKFGEVTRWISGTCQLRAKRMRSVIEEKYSLRAGRIVQRAKKDVRIDGKKINLG